MKVDLMTLGAVGFAGFAIWYVMRGGGLGGSGLTQAQADMYGMSGGQRRQSGDAQAQNTNWLNGWTYDELIASIQWGSKPYDASTATRRSDFQ